VNLKFLSDATFERACDASAAIPLGSFFLTASDELGPNDSNEALLYLPQGGSPQDTVDLGASQLLDAEPDKKEIDIEGATWIGDIAFWIGSHGHNSKAKLRPGRHRFGGLWMKLTDGKLAASRLGNVYHQLREDILARAGFPPAVDTLAPENGGLNIEGLAATPTGTLLIGLRSPLTANQEALLFEMVNPFGVVAGGEAANLSSIKSLDLGGLGIRDLTWCPQIREFLVVAGPADSADGPFRLFRWDGEGTVEPLAVDLTGLHPESILCHEGRVTLLSDDGDAVAGGQACKDRQPDSRSFRGRTWQWE